MLLMIFLIAQPMPCKTRISSISSLSEWFCWRLIRSCSQLAVHDQTRLKKLSAEIEGGDAVWCSHSTDELQILLRGRGGLRG